jgi:hypothetical protein
MNKLPPEALELLEEARRAEHAPPAALERNLKALHGSLVFSGLGIASGAEALDGAVNAAALKSTAPAAKVATTLFAGKSAKILLASVVLGGAVGGAQLIDAPKVERHARTQQVAVGAPALQASNQQPAEQVAPERVAPADDGLAPVNDAPALDAVAQPAPSTQRVTRTQTSRTPRARSLPMGERLASTAQASSVVAESSPASPAVEPAVQPEKAPTEPEAEAPKLASELDLIDGALLRLRAHDGDAALALLGEHRLRFASGKFVTERQALRVLALCELGRTREGRAEKAAFLARSSDAPIAARVRRACEGER